MICRPSAITLGISEFRQLRHSLFAGKRLLDIGRERRHLLRLTLGFALMEFRHHGVGEQLERFADVVVTVTAALLDERDLVHTGRCEFAQMCPHFVGRADAGRARILRHRNP